MAKLPSITWAELKRLVKRRGYDVETIRGSHCVVRKGSSQQFIVLPLRNRNEVVSPSHLAVVRRALREAGEIEDEIDQSWPEED